MENKIATNQAAPKTSEKDLLVQARKAALASENNAEQPEIKWLTENSRKFLESGYLTDSRRTY